MSSFGATRDEAVANLKVAVELYFEGESSNAYTPVSDLAVRVKGIPPTCPRPE